MAAPPDEPATDLPDAVEQEAGEILLGPPADVDARFAALCRRHAPMQAALLQLRRDFERAADLLGEPAPAVAAATTPPESVGPYRILRQIGAGAFGVVFLAEQREPIRREVALKLLHASAGSPGALARFLTERETLARMNHPAIARIFDAGVDANQRPYFVMEYVPGEPLHRFVARQQAGLPRLLELFLAACDGVHHAHQRGVIHRDLKPHNILVADVDGRWLPKVIDFGLAKALESDDHRAVRTHVGAVLGTPSYMSPEQVRGAAHAADTRTDVYALGVILYELLTGTLPFRAAAGNQGLVELQRQILEQDAPLASARAESIGLANARQLRGDLDWILRKAMAKHEADRYAGVAEFAADLRRFLAHEPVIAGPPSTSYLVRKFMRRHRGAMLAAALVLLSLLLGLGASLALYGRAQQHLADFWLLADVVELEQLEAEAQELWPSLPERLADHDRWLLRARALVARRPEHAAAVATLRRRLAAPAGMADDEARGGRFLLDRLQRHLTSLDAFAGDDGALPTVERRAQFARTVQQRSIDDHRADWDAARARVDATERYGGLDLTPLPGLVPLGPDPASGLEEFAMLQSGAVPVRRADGSLAIGNDTAIVLVLVPGGHYPIGSQSTEPTGPAYDPYRDSFEQELHDAPLRPFLLGKYELTQGQVRTLGMPQRAMGRAGSEHPFGPPFSPRHPEEAVLAPELQRLLPHYGLRLPRCNEWEVAARAGSTRVWGVGDRPEDLQGCANVADATLIDTGQRGIDADATVRDGYVVHAPVGTFAPNAFGFCDMIGNVSELTEAVTETGEPAVLARGGSYRLRPVECRIGVLRYVMPTQTSPDTGVRVARDLVPD